MGLECGRFDWECARGVMLGLLAFSTTIVGLLALCKMRRSAHRHKLDVAMVSLAFLQTLLSTVYFLMTSDNRVQFAVKYVRAMQNTLTFLVYSTLAQQVFVRRPMFGKALKPAVGAIVVYLTIIFLYVLGTGELDCDHSAFMLESVSGCVLAALFFIVGTVVMREMSRIIGGGVGGGTGGGGLPSFGFGGGEFGGADEGPSGEDREELRKRRSKLWMLLLLNGCSAVFQVVQDSVIHNAKNTYGTCQLHDVDDVGLQLGMIVLRILAYMIPVWGIYYVFFWVPRLQYENPEELSRKADYHLMDMGGDHDVHASDFQL